MSSLDLFKRTQIDSEGPWAVGGLQRPEFERKSNRGNPEPLVEPHHFDSKYHWFQKHPLSIQDLITGFDAFRRDALGSPRHKRQDRTAEYFLIAADCYEGMSMSDCMNKYNKSQRQLVEAIRRVQLIVKLAKGEITHE